MRKRTALILFLMWLCFAGGSALGETLTVYPDAALHAMSQNLYGIFFEDINHAADGGLYAELLQNRSFEYEELLNPLPRQHLTGWQFNTSAAGDGQATLSQDEPLNGNNPSYMAVNVTSAGYSFQNTGYTNSAFTGGIPLQAGEAYDLSLYLRNRDYEGSVEMSLTTKAGAALSDVAVAERMPAGEWTKYSFMLTATEDSDEACLTLTLRGMGQLDVDMVSLMPRDRVGADWPGGGLRRDLVEALRELHPRFIRFPGGCVAEGSWQWDNLYRWKDTIGPVESRKENWNTWGYMQSYGIGFYEYFCLCEEIGALPLPVVGSGLLCQAREPYEAPMNEAELADWIQDILDLAEFALGDAGTPYGALRAEMGHPEPFDLRMMAIGNENWADIYFNRYAAIREKVKEVWPALDIIVACGPVAEGSLFNGSRGKILKSFREDIADEHYYMESDWLLNNTRRYDNYPRDSRVFLGEFAAHEPAVSGRRPNNLYSALCEAAFMTGIERNSDAVVMCCYAPLLARTGMDQWTPDLIWFNGSQVLRTPNYYIQRMFSETLGEEMVDFDLKDAEGEAVKERTSRLYTMASRKADGTLYVKAVNVSGEEKPLTLRVDGAGNWQGRMVLLYGERSAVNSFTQERVVPEESQILLVEGEARIVMPPYCALTLTLTGE